MKHNLIIITSDNHIYINSWATQLSKIPHMNTLMSATDYENMVKIKFINAIRSI